MSNSINKKSDSSQYVQTSARSAEAPNASSASVVAETQTSIFQRVPTTALVKALPVVSTAYAALQISARKKAKSSDFSAPEGDKDQSIENSTEPKKAMQIAHHSGKQGNSDDSSDERDQSQLMYQRKLDELNQICRPGMSAADATHAQDLAMQVVLCANLATLSGTKSTRELNHIIGRMVSKLEQAGTTLPAENENLLGLLKTQSSNLPIFMRKKLADKDSITGHLLPLLLMALRRQSPAPSVGDPLMLYRVAA